MGNSNPTTLDGHTTRWRRVIADFQMDQHHLMLKFHTKDHMYVVIKIRCVWNKAFLLGPTVHQIPSNPTKASNDFSRTTLFKNIYIHILSNICSFKRCKLWIITRFLLQFVFRMNKENPCSHLWLWRSLYKLLFVHYKIKNYLLMYHFLLL